MTARNWELQRGLQKCLFPQPFCPLLVVQDTGSIGDVGEVVNAAIDSLRIHTKTVNE